MYKWAFGRESLKISPPASNTRPQPCYSNSTHRPGPLSSVSTRSYLEMQMLRAHLRSAESESAFREDPQIIHIHIEIGEAPVHNSVSQPSHCWHLWWIILCGGGHPVHRKMCGSTLGLNLLGNSCRSPLMVITDLHTLSVSPGANHPWLRTTGQSMRTGNILGELQSRLMVF